VEPTAFPSRDTTEKAGTVGGVSAEGAATATRLKPPTKNNQP